MGKRKSPPYSGDTLAPKERSERMSRVRSKDTKPELVVRRLLASMGYRFRLHVRWVPGNPDIVFPRRKKSFLCMVAIGTDTRIVQIVACQNQDLNFEDQSLACLRDGIFAALGLSLPGPAGRRSGGATAHERDRRDAGALRFRAHSRPAAARRLAR